VVRLPRAAHARAAALAVLAQLLALLLPLPQPALAAPPVSLAPSWYDDSVPPGYIALYKSGTRLLAPFQGWVPPGYDYWFLRAVTRSSLPQPLAAAVDVGGAVDAEVTPLIYEQAFSWQGGGTRAYAMPVTLNRGWNLVFLRRSGTASASGMWAHVNATSWSQLRFGDATGLPERFLPHSVIWSNETHAQVLVHAPQPGTYYLYWQPWVDVPDVSVGHPFFACVNNACGLRFNGFDQYGQSWASKSWFPSGAGSLVVDFLYFPNDTATSATFYAKDYAVAGTVVYDSSIGGYVLHVPASYSGYVMVVSNVAIGNGPFQLASHARGSASASNVIRVEVYDGAGNLVASYTCDVTTSYTWAERGVWMARAGVKYTLKVWVSGGVDVWLNMVGVMARRGSFGPLVNFYVAFARPSTVLFATRLPDGSWDNYQFSSSAVAATGRRLSTAAVVSASGKQFFVDGSLVASRAAGGLYSAAGHLLIAGTAYWRFYGLLFRVLAYNRTLSSSEVASAAAGGVPQGGLVLRLEAKPEHVFDVNWDGRVDWLDLSGSGNHVSLYNFHATGSFTGAVHAVWVSFVARSPSLSVSYRPGLGRLVVRWLPFGASLTVRDGAGRVVLTAVGQGLPVSAGLPPGRYTVEVGAAGAVLSGLALQPFYALSAQVYVSGAGSGVTVAPHLYDWYFSGGFLYAGNSASLNITGAFTLTTMVRNLFSTSTSIVTKRYYAEAPGGAPVPSCASYDAYALRVDSAGRAVAAVRTSAGSTLTVTDAANLGDVSNNRYVWLAAQYDGSYLKVFRNGTATSTSIGSVTLLTCPTLLTVAWDASGNYAYGYVSFLSLHRAAVSPVQVAAGKVVSAANLALFSDPTFWDGARYVDLSGNGNHLYPSGSVERVDAAAKWLWVVTGVGTPGGITFSFLPPGSMVHISSTTTSRWFVAAGSSPVFISLPAGAYTVTVYVPGGASPPSPAQVLVWGDGVFGTGAGLFAVVASEVRSAGARGWLRGFGYRKEVVVQGSPAGSLSSYPVPVVLRYGPGVDSGNVVHLGGKCRRDFGDVAFTASDGATPLAAWAEEVVEGEYAVFWVQVPVVPAFPSTTSIYVYYGGQPQPRLSPSAPALETFDGYPPGASIAVQGYGSARVYQFGGVKALQLSSPEAAGALTVAVAAQRLGRAVARVYFNASTAQGAFYLGWSDGTTFSSGRPVKSLLAYLHPGGLQVRADWSTVLSSRAVTVASGTWYRLEVRWFAGYAEAVLSSSALSGATYTFTASAPAGGYSYLTMGVNSSAAMLVDWVALLPGAYPDVHIAAVMAEERAPPAAALVTLPERLPAVEPPRALIPSPTGDPVARLVLAGSFAAAVVVAAIRLELRLSVALVLAGAVVLVVGLLLGDGALVALGAVLIAIGAALASI